MHRECIAMCGDSIENHWLCRRCERCSRQPALPSPASLASSASVFLQNLALTVMTSRGCLRIRFLGCTADITTKLLRLDEVTPDIEVCHTPA